MKRTRVKKPGQEVFKSELSEYIKAEELYIGAKVNVNGYLFLLLNADKYTLNFMEANSDKVSCLWHSPLAPQHSAVCVFLSLGLFFFLPALHCAFTHVAMNNGSARLGHRSRSPLFTCWALRCPAARMPGTGRRQAQD